jgi:methylmalonyl-CoA mutase N-terminal domain/subunit
MEEEERPVEMRPARPQAVAEQIDHLERIRAGRDDTRVMLALRRISDDARNDRNVLPGVIDTVKVSDTVGEVTQCLAGDYGRYEEPVAL